MLKRANTILNKHIRSIKKTPLHTQKNKYRVDVKRFTERSKKENYIENIHLVDKYNYNLDHIYPVMLGFKNNVPPHLIGHINNLKVIKKLDNIKKRMNLNYDEIDKNLFKEYL